MTDGPLAIDSPPTSRAFSGARSLVVVGNGPSALEGDRGETIDSFDRIVRFNRFVVAGFERQLGQRTDIWCRCGHREGGTPEQAVATGARALLLVSDSDKEEQHRRAVAELEQALPLFEILPAEIWHRVREAMGGAHPSAGMLVLTYALDWVPRVHVVGFDCMSARRHHYFEPGADRARQIGRHEPSAEQRYYSSLLTSGRLHEL